MVNGVIMVGRVVGSIWCGVWAAKKAYNAVKGE